jgi:hypothetical protein
MATEQEAEDAHRSTARLGWSLPHRDLPRPLLLLSTTVYAVVSRFVREERAAFDDRGRRGPKPLLEDAANEYIGRLVEEEPPTEHGWLRSPASLELQAPCSTTIQGASRFGEPGDWAPHAPSPRFPLEKAASGPARERFRRATGAKAREARRYPANDRESGFFLPGRDQTRKPTPKWVSVGCARVARDG